MAHHFLRESNFYQERCECKNALANEIPPRRRPILCNRLQFSDINEIAGLMIPTRCLARPTAVIASNDLTAIGALGVIHEMGLRVPEDISLIGFDDIAFAHLINLPLTTVVLSRGQLALTALAALESLIEGNDSLSNLTIPTQLVMRSSTRAL